MDNTKYLLIGIVVIVFLYWYQKKYSIDYTGMKHPIKTGRLNSAMKYLVIHTKSDDKMSVQIRVNVGSRDETKKIGGISHILEHMFFQGSETYPTSKELQVEIYACGGNFNAYTDYHETVFHTEGSNKCKEKIVEIMSDSLYHSLLDPQKLQNEKKVVINEINDNLSNPKYVVSHNLYEIAFQGTSFEKDVAGTAESVKRISARMLKNFINTYYSKDMIVTLCSSDPPEQGVKLLKQYFSRIPHYEVKPMSLNNPKDRIMYPDHLFNQKQGKIRYTKDTSAQSFISISFPSFKYSDNRRDYAMILISEILTGYMNSRLYAILRQEKGLIYHIHSDSEFYEDLGVFRISCTTKNQKTKVSTCLQLILETVMELSQTLTKKDLDSSMKHLIESIHLGKNEPRFVGAEYTQDLYHLGKVFTLDEKVKTIKSIQIQDIVSVAKEVFQPKYCCISYSGSKEYLE